MAGGREKRSVVKMKFKFSIPKTIDWILYLVPVILTIAGIVVIYSLTYYNNQINIFYNQIIYGAIGVILMLVFTFIDYRNFKGLAIYLYIIGLILLLVVLFFGKKVLGATRWIDLGIFQLQPAELFKLFLAIILAKYFSDRGADSIRVKDLIFGGLLFIIPAVLVMRQPDFGTLVILFIITLAIILASKIKKTHLIVIGFLILAAVGGTWFLLKDYQKERIYTFLNPAADPYGAGYNVMQSTITVGSGGLFGRGLGHGPQSQLNFLPIAHTDFIFAGVAEATGFAGSAVLIILLGILTYRVIGVGTISKDKFGMLFAVGIAAMFLFQSFINIGMNLGIMPVTGIPLPFVSAGGTALITNFVAIGILQSIYLRHKKITF